LGNTLNALGSCLKKQADPQAALKYYLEAVEIRQELVERMPADVECRRTLANTYMNIGLVQEPSEPGEARKHFERAQRIRQEMLTNGCDDLNVRRDLAKGYYNLADLAQAQNDLPAADGCLERAVELFRELSQDDASGIEAEYSLALAYRKWADLKSLRQVPEDAISLYGDARELMSKLVRENPAVPAYRAGLAEICMNAGTIEHETGRHHEAVSSFTTAVELLADLLGDQSESARYRQLYLTSLSALPVVQAVAEHYADAYRTTETLRDYLVNDGCQEQALQTLETLREYVKQVVEMRTDDADARTLLEQMNAAIQSLREQQAEENAAN
jgi:tetratricopeptide (TPR) repeat protein